jgi:hypothetical protein
LIWGCRPVCYGQNRRIALQLFLIWEWYEFVAYGMLELLFEGCKVNGGG